MMGPSENVRLCQHPPMECIRRPTLRCHCCLLLDHHLPCLHHRPQLVRNDSKAVRDVLDPPPLLQPVLAEHPPFLIQRPKELQWHSKCVWRMGHPTQIRMHLALSRDEHVCRRISSFSKPRGIACVWRSDQAVRRELCTVFQSVDCEASTEVNDPCAERCLHIDRRTGRPLCQSGRVFAHLRLNSNFLLRHQHPSTVLAIPEIELS